MAELSLKQIEDKLNSEFNKKDRVIIFWYDEKQEFIDDIENLNFGNAKIHHLTPTNLFKTKVLLERKDKENNYLIYASFRKPDNRNNHLADTILYSKEFFADRLSLLASDLGIDTAYKQILEKHSKFFNAKDRTKRFYDLEVDIYNERNIEITLLAASVKSKVANFEEVVRIVLSENLSDNKYMRELSDYNLGEIFWKYCRINFSYMDEEPNLTKFSISLLLTYAENQMNKGLFSNLDKYILDKPGTVMTFMDQMMNSNLYRDSFRRISDEVYNSIGGNKIFENCEIEDLIDVDVFRETDKIIINWVLDRLLDENLNAKIKNLTIPEICESRKSKHFRDLYNNQYDVLINAYYLMLNKNFKPEENIIDLVDKYGNKYYKIDTYYRKFYYHLDTIEVSSIFERLQTLVENIYVNRYLDVVSKEFNNLLDYNKLKSKYRLQRNFYSNFVAEKNERIIVIISDAFRYEVAKELVERFEFDEKIESKIELQIGVLPSYTGLGMAVLLPNKHIDISDDYEVYVDGKPTGNLVERNFILQSENPKSDGIQYDDLIKMKRQEIRQFFAGKEVIYIYHNQIDARAHSIEDEVFDACHDAMVEIENIIKKLTSDISATSFLVTADHGFIYTRSKNKESDIFKTRGGGQNFVHGGSSLQEIIVPVIEVKTIRGAVEVEKVKISLISMISKITSLLLSLDFVQLDPVLDIIKPATYKIRFIDDDGELISNEEIHVAESKLKDSSDRVFNLRFRLRNKKYSRDEKYYFTITDIETDMEIYRQQVIIDIAFANDIGFDI